MIKRLIHFSDLHVRLFKDHELYRSILQTALKEWETLQPDRIVFTGDLVHSKNQMTPELVEFVAWVLSECAKIAKMNVLKLPKLWLLLEIMISLKTTTQGWMLSLLLLIH